MKFGLEPIDLEHEIDHDTIAYDAEGHPVLIVVAKALRDAVETGTTSTLAAMTLAGVPFGMYLDPDNLWIFRADSANPREPVLKLRTQEALSPYSHLLTTQKYFFRSLLDRPAEAWLRDIVHGRKHARPPAIDELEAIGLAGRLLGGSTQNGFYRAYVHLH